jgi:hypothetical protein
MRRDAMRRLMQGVPPQVGRVHLPFFGGVMGTEIGGNLTPTLIGSNVSAMKTPPPALANGTTLPVLADGLQAAATGPHGAHTSTAFGDVYGRDGRDG